MKGINGGRTRTRTLDPLIKSQIFSVGFQYLGYKLSLFRTIRKQWVTSKMQTAVSLREPASAHRYERFSLSGNTSSFRGCPLSPFHHQNRNFLSCRSRVHIVCDVCFTPESGHS
jgi:hypothetical protein